MQVFHFKRGDVFMSKPHHHFFCIFLRNHIDYIVQRPLPFAGDIMQVFPLIVTFSAAGPIFYRFSPKYRFVSIQDL